MGAFRYTLHTAASVTVLPAHPRVRAKDDVGPTGSRVKHLVLEVVPKAHVLAHSAGAAVCKLAPVAKVHGVHGTGCQVLHSVACERLLIQLQPSVCRLTCWRMPVPWQQVWHSTSSRG